MAKKRNVSEKTYIKVIVNLKCLGYVPKILRGFTQKERGAIYDGIGKSALLHEMKPVLYIIE